MRFFILLIAGVLSFTAVWADEKQSPKAPNDPFFSRQWALHNDGTQTVQFSFDDSHTITQKGKAGIDIGWLEAKDDMNNRARGQVIVAVVDSGAEISHPDLQGRILPDGWNFLSGEPAGGDPWGHGTQVAGMIAANSDNGVGIAGVAPATVKILPLVIVANCTIQSDLCFKNSLLKGKPVSDYAADAIRYAVAHHADIINLSIVWPGYVDTENARNAFREAINAGVIIIAAAGNDRKIHAPYPCAYEGVVCVGAVTNTGEMSTYSNRSGLVDILAPGDDIVGTFPTSLDSQDLREKGYELSSGTSDATPILTGAAAAIKSIYPEITAPQLIARLFSSTAPLLKGQKALYGLVNLKRALDLGPQAVFWPDFRTLGTLSIDEKDLSIQGQLRVRDLRPNSTLDMSKPLNVTAKIAINGKDAGQVAIKSQPNGTFSIPWKYKFDSLDVPGDVFFKVTVTADNGFNHDFKFQTLASRKIQNVGKNKIYSVHGVNPLDWIHKGSVNHYFTNLSTVENLYSPTSAPIYYFQNGNQLQLFDTSGNDNAVSVSVPGIDKVTEVVCLDVLKQGERDFVVIGPGKNAGEDYLEFYFLNSKGEPLTGSQSIWQVNLNTPLFQNILTNYGGASSWVSWTDPVLKRSRLIPSFFSKNRLPDKDNVNPFNPLYYASDFHLYFMIPIAKPGATGPSQLEVRAVDSAKFRAPYREFHLINMIHSKANAPIDGHTRFLVELGSDGSAPIKILDVPSVDKMSLIDSSWDYISANSSFVGAMSSQALFNSSAYFNIYKDGGHGSIAWAAEDGTFEGRTEFQYVSPLDPIQGLLGSFRFPTGNYFFLLTTFEGVGIYLPQGPKGEQIVQKIPIERDSTMGSDDFLNIFKSVVVGTTAHPVPGIFSDYTWVQGDQVSVLAWDTDHNKVTRPLRYSLQIPDKCLEMNPAYMNVKVESLVFPVVCQGQTETSQPNLTLVSPN